MLRTPFLRIVVLVGAVTTTGAPDGGAAAGPTWQRRDHARSVGLAVPVEREGRFRALAAGVYLSAMADWASTRRFREEGIEEANPGIDRLADDPTALAVVKAGGGTLVNYVSYRLREHGSRIWAVPQIVWIALNLAAAIHNADAAD